jgi:hypothetical protein
MFHPAVCLHKIYKSRVHCRNNIVHKNRWMIHRVQPFRIERIPGKKFSFPICCPNASKYDYNSIPEQTQKDLFQYWRDLNGVGKKYFMNRSSWKTEWNTYGTCSGLDVNTYFAKSMEFAKKFDISTALLKHGIVPNTTQIVKREDIVTALEMELKATPIFGCFYMDQFKDPILNEMSFFVTKDFVPLMNWPERLKHKFWTCSKSEFVIPVVTPTDLLNNEEEVISLADYQ